MFGTIRKHQTWLWVVVIGITILGMVSFFSPTSQFHSGGVAEGNFGVIDGVRVTQDEFFNARNEAYLKFFLTRRADSRETFDGDPALRETYLRLFEIRKLKQYNIDVDSGSVVLAARNLLSRLGVSLDDLLRAMAQKRENIQSADFERYIRHQLGIEQLAMMVGLGGDLVTPQEVESLYERLHRELATSAVFFPVSNYLAAVTAPSPDALARFYTNHVFDYRLPDRVQVSYLRFDYSNYLAQVQQVYTNLDLDVEANFIKLGTNYVHFGKTPEEARKKIGEELFRQHLMYEAHTEASRLLNGLFQQFQQTAPRLEHLAALAASNQLVLKVTAPFDASEGPTEFDGGPNFARTAFLLTSEEPVAGRVIMGENSAFLIALDRKIPSEDPPLDRIHDRVLADYNHSHALEMAEQAGEQFYQTVTNGLAHGKSFAAIGAEAKVKPVTVPPFSMQTEPQIGSEINAYEYKQNAFSTPVGQAGYFSPSRFGSVVYFVEKRLPVDTARMKAALPEFHKTVRQQRQQEFYNAWYQREASKSLGQIPVFRPAPSVPGPGKS